MFVYIYMCVCVLLGFEKAVKRAGVCVCACVRVCVWTCVCLRSGGSCGGGAAEAKLSAE